MRAGLVAGLLLAGCTTAPGPAHLITVTPAPAPVVVTEVQRVIIRVPAAPPPPRGRGLLAAYDQTRPELGAAVARAHRPETVDRLSLLDRQVRQALQPFRSHPRQTNQAEVDAAIDALGALRLALAAAPP